MSKLESLVVASAARFGLNELVLLVVGIAIVVAVSVSLVLRLGY